MGPSLKEEADWTLRIALLVMALAIAAFAYVATNVLLH
jgi:hypothetical protein